MTPNADYGALLEDAACLLIEVRRVCTGSPPHQIVGDNLNAMKTCPAHIDQAGTPCGAELFDGQLIGERDEDAMAVIARLMGAIGDRMAPPKNSGAPWNADYEALIVEARMGQDGCEDCVLLGMLADALEQLLAHIEGVPAMPNADRGAVIKSLISRNLDVLNRLEPHLGCACCHGPLIGGRCPDCQGVSHNDSSGA